MRQYLLGDISDPFLTNLIPVKVEDSSPELDLDSNSSEQSNFCRFLEYFDFEADKKPTDLTSHHNIQNSIATSPLKNSDLADPIVPVKKEVTCCYEARRYRGAGRSHPEPNTSGRKRRRDCTATVTTSTHLWLSEAYGVKLNSTLLKET
ncbi:uncharacterized protein HKW66_Vig0190240 [Vigna angularis]|uniref:Uncharacterized protein n=1 Tax=Phaseolus angularis TaxID=3914 RepID=A0A8T0KRU7_PHAAN|nr:uncharacterized protein HKW66_Vig0190240 [Vigna angularis]